MKKLLLAICLLLCALMPNFAEPTSSPQSEQIPMGYDKTNSQNGTPRTIRPNRRLKWIPTPNIPKELAFLLYL